MIATLLLLSAPADAFKFRDPAMKWTTEDFPLTFYTSSYLEDSLPQTLDPETGRFPQEDLAIKAFCNWHWSEYCDEQLDATWQQYETAQCADIPFEYGGAVNGHTGANDDGQFVIYWDDPADNLGTGVNGVSTARPNSGVVDTIGGEPIYQFRQCDITMNNDITWGLTNDMEEGCQSGTMSAESTLTHEVGHCLGMGHSCDDGELCIDSTLLTATMFWQGGPCDTSRASIGEDDIEGITALYGPYITWDVTEESVRFGAAPLEVCFQLDSDEEYLDQIQGVEWTFGDGGTSTELNPCHTFADQGQFTVTANIDGLSDSCGEWDVSQTQRAHVLVCETPVPDFQLNHENGLIYQLINMTDVSTYGCIDGLEWEVYSGGSADGEPVIAYSAWSPKLDFTELGEGTYTVRLTAMGPAGEDSIESSFDIEEKRGEGALLSCSSAAGGMGGSGLAFAGLALAFVFGRRRRS